MNMQTVGVKLYKFDELSDEAQEKALEKHRLYDVEGIDWWDSVYYDWKEKLNKKGFLNTEIFFSGFCSQGDGACFDCDQFDYDKLEQACYLNALERAIISFFYETSRIEIAIVKNNFAIRYCHYNTRYVSLYNDEYPKDLDDLIAAKPEDLPLMIGQIDEDLKDILEIRMKHPELSCDGVGPFMKRFESAVEELRSDLCKEIYRDLESAYGFLVSDENVREALSENDYNFTEDGEIE